MTTFGHSTNNTMQNLSNNVPWTRWSMSTTLYMSYTNHILLHMYIAKEKVYWKHIKYICFPLNLFIIIFIMSTFDGRIVGDTRTGHLKLHVKLNFRSTHQFIVLLSNQTKSRVAYVNKLRSLLYEMYEM